MQCNGKCHLKKQLEKDEKKQELPNSLKEKSEIQFCSTPFVTAFAFTSTQIFHNTIYSATYPDKPAAAIFHPPSCC